MTRDIKGILEKVQSGGLSVEEAVLALKKAPFEDIGYAKIDHHRRLRQGAAEVIYGAGKTPEHMVGIIERMVANDEKTIVITRMSEDDAMAVNKIHPLSYYKEARVGIVGNLPEPSDCGYILVATGG